MSICLERTAMRFSERFIQERVYLKNVSKKTKVFYRTAFKAFEGTEETRAAINAKIVELRKRGLSAISVNAYLRVINAYLRWGGENGLFDTLPVPKLQEETKLLATFSPTQLATLRKAQPSAFGRRRVWVMAMLALDTGLRLAELLSLRRTSVDLDNLLVRVLGKGRKERLVPISFEGRKILFRWLQSHSFDWVFPTANGTQLGLRNSQRDFRELCRRLGLSGVRCSFHTLRHTFAVNYIRAGGSVFHLQRILGHTTLEMSRRYVNLQTQDLEAVHGRFSPLAGIAQMGL
jgi:integrase/recombinase XerD